MIEELSAGRPVRLFADEYRTPIFLGSLCEILLEVARRPGIRGLLHVGGHERVSRFEFGERVCEARGLDKGLLVPIEAARFPSREPRPPDCSLDSTRARDILETRIPSLTRALGG